MWFRTALLTALIATGCAAGGARDSAPAPPAPADFRAISVRGMDGAALPLASVLGGRPTLVSFWAPWCEPCLREQPELERLSRAVNACGGAVAGVAVGESAATVSAFVRDHALTFPQFTDDDFHLADAMGQRRIPAIVVFDQAARVVYTGNALADAALDAMASVMPARTDGARCQLRAR
jgi:thiol-disulfide isomerase/thioredoxin